MIRSLTVLAILTVAATAAARPLDREPTEPDNLPPPIAPPPAKVEPVIPRKVTVTLQALKIQFPLFEAMGELEVTPKISASLILGAGRATGSDGGHGQGFEVGAQGSYYFKDQFRGLHAGAELLYMHAPDVIGNTLLVSPGIALGPFIGWKYIHRSGFTFLAQGGLAFVVGTNSPGVGSDSPNQVLLILNLNAGWSF